MVLNFMLNHLLMIPRFFLLSMIQIYQHLNKTMIWSSSHSGLTNGRMCFNPDSTKQAVQVIFSRKTNKPSHPETFFNNTEVESVNEHKNLGLTLDANVCFSY